LNKFHFPDETLAVAKPQIIEKTFALSSVTENGVFVSLYEISGNQIAEFKLLKSKDYSAKLDENFLTITDEFGRVIIFDHQEKVLRGNLRF
jgi:hypothetical protein